MLLMKHDLTGAEKEARQPSRSTRNREQLWGFGEILLLQHDTKQAGEAFRNAAQLAPLRSAVRLRDIDFSCGPEMPPKRKKTWRSFPRRPLITFRPGSTR